MEMIFVKVGWNNEYWILYEFCLVYSSLEEALRQGLKFKLKCFILEDYPRKHYKSSEE